MLRKARHPCGNLPHGETDFYPLLAEVGKELDSGVFCCLTLVDTESVVRQAGNRSVVPPPDRPPPRRCARVRSDVDAPHRPENASVPWTRHDSSAIVKTPRPERQSQTTFPSLRTTAPESRPSPNAV